MPLFTSDGFKPVNAESLSAAARVFATRQARRDFGQRGYCRTLRLDSWASNDKYAGYQAFIGRDNKYTGACEGHSVWIYVVREKEGVTK